MSNVQQVQYPSTFYLRRRTPGSFVLIPCPQQGRPIRCQGQLEAAAATILVACPCVVHIQEQPLSIWYDWQGADDDLKIQILDGPPGGPGKRENHAGTSYIVPDFLVEMADGRKRLIEVKPSHRLDRPIVQRKLAVGQAHAERSGWSFHVITEKELLGKPLLENVRLLNRYRHGQFKARVLDRLVRKVTANGSKMCELVSEDRDSQPINLSVQVLHLLAVGRLSHDPRLRPLDDQSLIFPGGAISWDPFDSVWGPNGCSTGGPSV